MSPLPLLPLETQTPTRLWHHRRRWPWALAVLVWLLTAAWWGHTLAWHNALDQLDRDAQHRLDVAATRLDGELARFNYLPALLETSPEVFQLLATPADTTLREQVSRHLQALNAIAGADILYVIDTAGTVVAAADWNRPGTPFAKDLSYRPYVIDALAKGRGHFYGIGITSGRAGYYLSFSLPRHGQPQGVAAVKVNLVAIEEEWRRQPGERLLVDERGVVILSTQEAWKYHPLAEMTPQARADATHARSYGQSDLKPLAWQVRETQATDGTHTLTRLRLDRKAYVASERSVNHGQWRLIVLDTETTLHSSARNAAISAALAAAVVVLVSLVLWQDRREIRQQRANRAILQSAHDTLEQRVQERTAELQAAQNDLVHAGKLAALGQMSAGIAHELNQPLAALHTLSDNAAVLLDHQRTAEARANLVRISHLVDRLGRTTYQLKAFAHKTIEPPQPVALHKLIQDTLLGLGPRLREHPEPVDIDVQIEPPTLKVMAESMRLEQVLVNLISNALDAMANTPQPRLSLRARVDTRSNAAAAPRVLIEVANNGPVMPEQVLQRLFEPFVTTKPAGKGLGLGLVISAQIMDSFGGRLQGANRVATTADPLETGVIFTLELPQAPLPPHPEPTPGSALA